MLAVSYHLKWPENFRFHFLLTHYYCGGQVSVNFRKLYSEPDLCYPPLVGAAMPLSIDGHPPPTDLNESDGHIFSFLPLPLEQRTPTGLPVHVNGFWALEHNRKYLKWPTLRQSREENLDPRLMWNHCMLSEALPKCYAELLLAAIERAQSSQPQESPLNKQVIYRAFPSISRIDRKWDLILLPLYAELFKYKVIYTKANGGCWVQPREAIFDTLAENPETKEAIIKVELILH